MWEPDFEPYLVLPTKYAPKFDTRFAGFGWNKVGNQLRFYINSFIHPFQFYTLKFSHIVFICTFRFEGIIHDGVGSHGI